MRDPACSVRAATYGESRVPPRTAIRSAPRVDVDLRARAPAGLPLAGEHARDLVEADDPGDERRGIHAAGRVEADGAVEARRAAEDADRR